MNTLFQSHAGRATVAISLGCLFIVWPPSINFAAALLLLGYGILNLRQSFSLLDAELEAAVEPDA